MRDIIQSKPKKKKLTFDDYMGILIGFGIVIFALPFIKSYIQLGFIPLFFISMISFWIVKNISKKIRMGRIRKINQQTRMGIVGNGSRIGWHNKDIDDFICLKCAKNKQNFDDYRLITARKLKNDIFTCDKCGRIFDIQKNNKKSVGVKKKGLAIASLVFGIIGGFPWISIVSVIAVVCGHTALIKIKKYPNKYTGRGFAIAGLILGYLGLVLAIALGIMQGVLKNVMIGL